MKPGSDWPTKRVRLAGESVVLHDADQIQLRPGEAARALQADLRIGDLQARLVDIGAVGQRVGDQVLHGADFVGRGDGQGVGGDDAGVRHLGVFVAAARDHVLEDGFLFLAQAAGIDQVLAGGEHLGVGARHLHLRERAFFHLRAHVGEQLLGEGHVSCFTFSSSISATRSV